MPAPLPEQVLERSAWREELLKVLIFALFGALIGMLFGHAAAGVALVLGLFVFIYLRHLARIRVWIQSPKHFDLPEAGGLWGEVFDRLLDWQRRNRKKKKRLANMLAEFQASTAALPDGAVVLAERGDIVWYNDAAQRLLGLRAQDTGLRVANLIRVPVFSDYMTQGEFDKEKEIEVPSPLSRNRTLSLRIIPYGTNQKLLIVRDVSELRRLETARRDFVANASHELRTPLTVLRGYLDMLEPEAQKGPLAGWHAPIVEMKNQAVRMESLVSDMLRLARLETESQTQTQQNLLDVPAILRRVLEEARAMSQTQHRFESQIEPGLYLLGTETEAQSIFSNLVSNAVRYTPAGGVIRVEWRSDAGGARFACADSGIGIAQQDIPRLTERFYRVDVGRSRASGGTGLGLSIVKHALERHEGSLQIDSEVGVGSTFICRFPAHRVQKEAVALAE